MKKNPIAAVIISAAKKRGKQEDPESEVAGVEEEDGREDLELVAEELIGAVKNEDSKAVASILEKFVGMC